MIKFVAKLLFAILFNKQVRPKNRKVETQVSYCKCFVTYMART